MRASYSTYNSRCIHRRYRAALRRAYIAHNGVRVRVGAGAGAVGEERFGPAELAPCVGRRHARPMALRRPRRRSAVATAARSTVEMRKKQKNADDVTG